MSRQRLIPALLIAPLMTPLTFVVTVVSRRSVPPSSSIIPVVFALYTPFAYTATVIFGIPMLFLFRRLRWKNPFLFIVGGVLIGFVTALLVFSLLTSWTVLKGDYAWSAIAGAFSALVFWVILYGFKSDEVIVYNHGEI
jgi:hypothetical protein